MRSQVWGFCGDTTNTIKEKNYIMPEDILEIARYLQEIGAMTGSNILI